MMSSFALAPLEELYEYLKGARDAISLESLVYLLRAGYIEPSLFNPISVNVRLSNGVVIRGITIPLDLSTEEGMEDARRLVFTMLRYFDELTPGERRILCTLARRLGIRVERPPREERRSSSLTLEILLV